MKNVIENEDCSFCGRKYNDYDYLFTGNDNAAICNYCTKKINESIDAKVRSKSNKNLILIPPIEMKKFLDDFVIGQDEAKKILSVAVYNHYKRLMQEITKDNVVIEKSNVIMIGNTGVGKTYLVKAIAKILKVPFCIADATVLTEAGYVGEDVETILTRLLQASDYNIDLAERGIIYIDELDKISRKAGNPSTTKDVGGEGVQQSLLKLLEGSVVNVPPQGGRKHPDQQYLHVNTQNILFICGGAFNGIESIIKKRLNVQPLGFMTNVSKERQEIKSEQIIQYVNSIDLREFGLIPEIIGRLPVLAHLNTLDNDALKKILTKPKNALIKQYKKLLKMEGINLTFENSVLDYIAEKAIEFKLGARGLKVITEAIMTDVMYELPSKKDVRSYKITLKYAKEKIKNSKFSLLKVAS